MVEQGVLARADLLLLFPVEDPVVVPEAGVDVFVSDPRLARDVHVTVRRVGHDHLVGAIGVLEVIVDALFLHQPARKVEIALPILHAVVALVEDALQLIGHVDTVENLLQDVRHFLVLENAALGLAGP
jgi:hypothetical protein